MQNYIDYNFYTGIYGGDSIPPLSFLKYSLKASLYINHITFNRIKDLEVISQEIQMATCSVADELYKIENDGGLKASESTGNHSVSYKNNDNMTEGKKLYNAAQIYLAHTGLLYKGIERCSK